jgi:hypothetical protein
MSHLPSDDRFGGVFDGDEVSGVLSGAFYSPKGVGDSDARAAKEHARLVAAKPDHYKVICISLYTEDLTHLDGLVKQLKHRGLTKANRSALIREALNQVDLSKIGKGM